VNISYKTRTLQKLTEKFALLITLFTFKLQQAQKIQKARKIKVNPSATLGHEIEAEKLMS
jgi:hypothetical protein